MPLLKNKKYQLVIQMGPGRTGMFMFNNGTAQRNKVVLGDKKAEIAKGGLFNF
jgi:hypothetical protein